MGTQSKAIGAVVGVGVGEAISEVAMYFLKLAPVVAQMPENVLAATELIILAAVTYVITYAFPANKQQNFIP